MANSNPIVVGGGIQSGSPFTLGHLVYITNVTPAQLSSYAAKVTTDAVSAVVYTDIPDSTGAYLATTNLTETLRVNGGAVLNGSGTTSVQVGAGATATKTDTVAIGRAAVANVTQAVVIGATATCAGQQGVVVGFGASFSSASGVAVGAGANVTGNAGGAAGIAIGTSASAQNSSAGAGDSMAIGRNARASQEDIVIGANASSNQQSVLGVFSVVIGEGTTANVAGGSVYAVVIGSAASTTQKLSVVLGGGAAASGSAKTRSVVIGANASSAETDAIVIGGGSVLTTKSIAIGAGAAELGAGVLQLGASGTPISTVLIGAGNTIAGPSVKTIRFTNATGADNAAGAVVMQAPLSTGNGLPAAWVFQVGKQLGSGSTLQTATEVIRIVDGGVQWTAGNGTGAGSALLGTNSPSAHLSAPYTWVDVFAGDGTACTMPIWQK